MKGRPSASSKDADGSPVYQAKPPESLDEAAVSNDRPHSDAPLSPSSTRSRRSTNVNWRVSRDRNGSTETPFVVPAATAVVKTNAMDRDIKASPPLNPNSSSTFRLRRGPWSITFLILLVSTVGLGLLSTILYSLATRQLDPKGCRMSYMRPSYIKFSEFDTEHTRFASKYSLYLYREQTVDDDKLRGIPVLFVPGNAGSYKQVRPIAAEASNYFNDVVQHDEAAIAAGTRNLDFFTVDFNEDITAFHGQTLLDQAEYLNEAIRYILSLYMDPRMSPRSSDIPDPTSVIVLGHSMGGVVARTMLVMPNYQTNSINTIITMSAPHSQAPVTFDGQIVHIYDTINSYWRNAYAEKWANNNPLWHVTLVSIAGGGLDTVVPSDYASIESMVPETHGFTVFTTTIPTVWTSMDHQAILWCDQFRKVVTRALYNIVDVGRASQTKPRAERMRVFKKWFLTGLEPDAEKSLPYQIPSTLLILGDSTNTVIPDGERLTIRQLGGDSKPRAYLMPVQPPGSPQSTRFTFLSDTPLSSPGGSGNLEVLLCSVATPQPGQPTLALPINVDLSGDGDESAKFVCKSAVFDLITLPRSAQTSKYPFPLPNDSQNRPFSYLEYDAEDLADHQFVVVLDKSTSPTDGFILAEFADHASSVRTKDVSLQELLAFGISLRLLPNRSTVSQVHIPAVESSLLAYRLQIESGKCTKSAELFAPLVRQYLTRPYESKFFVNARTAEISIHGISPFVPPPLKPYDDDRGLGFQIWTDPTCETEIVIKLEIDILGSFGKLYMRYRTVFAAFPLLIVALVLAKQFQLYDETGVFVSFAEGLDLSLRRSFPGTLFCLTIISISGWGASKALGSGLGASGTPGIDFYQNDSVTGMSDPFFWFLIPIIGSVSVGVCVGVHYLTLSLIQITGIICGLFAQHAVDTDEARRIVSSPGLFSPTSPQRRAITTGVLLILVSTFIPYQFAYLVACLVQLITTVRALRALSNHQQMMNYNFYNYAHSIFLLMLWVLPINLPILAVWLRNLAVQWLTPFSSHHNVLSIISFILLVENMTTSKMIPRVTGRLRHVTGALLIGTAFYAGVYGITYAYRLHHLVHIISTWLVLIYLTSGSWSLVSLKAVFDDDMIEARKRGKTP